MTFCVLCGVWCAAAWPVLSCSTALRVVIAKSGAGAATTAGAAAAASPGDNDKSSDVAVAGAPQPSTATATNTATGPSLPAVAPLATPSSTTATAVPAPSGTVGSGSNAVITAPSALHTPAVEPGANGSSGVLATPASVASVSSRPPLVTTTSEPVFGTAGAPAPSRDLAGAPIGGRSGATSVLADAAPSGLTLPTTSTSLAAAASFVSTSSVGTAATVAGLTSPSGHHVMPHSVTAPASSWAAAGVGDGHHAVLHPGSSMHSLGAASVPATAPAAPPLAKGQCEVVFQGLNGMLTCFRVSVDEPLAALKPKLEVGGVACWRC